MAVRRSAAVRKDGEQQKNDEVRLMERLVRKSLMVNPELAEGKDFGQAYADLRRQVSPRLDDEPQVLSPRDKAERRAGMARFFLREKQEDLELSLQEIEEQERILAAKKDEIRRRTLEDAAEFLALLAARDQESLPKIVEDNRHFWARLGITEREALMHIKRAL